MGVNVAVEAEAAPLSGAAVTLTNAVPQYMEMVLAAPEYVLLMGCVEFAAKDEKMAISSWRHELQVGREPPGMLTPSGK